MLREAERPWTRSASGHALQGKAFTTDLPAMIAMFVFTASVVHTCYAIVQSSPRRLSSMVNPYRSLGHLSCCLAVTLSSPGRRRASGRTFLQVSCSIYNLH